MTSTIVIPWAAMAVSSPVFIDRIGYNRTNDCRYNVNSNIFWALTF